MEQLGHYSNQGHRLEVLQRLLGARLKRRRPASAPKQRQNHLDSADQAKVVEAYQAGDSVYDIARQFAIGRTTASAILKRHGVTLRYKVLTDRDLSIAIRLYETDCWSLTRIAERFGVAAKTVHTALRRSGVQLRPVGTNQWTDKQV